MTNVEIGKKRGRTGESSVVAFLRKFQKYCIKLLLRRGGRKSRILQDYPAGIHTEKNMGIKRPLGLLLRNTSIATPERRKLMTEKRRIKSVGTPMGGWSSIVLPGELTMVTLSRLCRVSWGDVF